MGCLRLTYDHEETPTLFLEQAPEKVEAPKLRVWVNPEGAFLGVGEETLTQGVAYVFGSNGALIDSHSIDGPSVAYFMNNGKLGKAYYDLGALQQFVAIVAGESGNNFDESTGIAQVIINRMNHKGSGLSSGFVNTIGGTGQYDAIGGTIYNSVMNSSLSDIFSSSFDYATRVQGAMRGLAGGLDMSGGAYFWNASSPQSGFNWNQYNNGTFVQTGSWGGTTFFKYSDAKRVWP
jgi:hypothetical protein